MRQLRAVERGEEYHPDVSPAGLKGMHGRERPGKSRAMLQAAVPRKSDNTLGEIRHRGAPGERHPRVAPPAEARGLGRRHDQKSPGRRRSPMPKQEGATKGDLGKPPSESGFERGGWNSKLLARRIQDRFGIVCSRRTALRAAARLGFSTRKPRPVPYNGATAEEQARFVREREGAIARWRAEGRAILSINGATLRDSPASRRDLRPRGGRDTVCTNHSRKPINLIGALGDGTPGLQFHHDLKADSYIASL